MNINDTTTINGEAASARRREVNDAELEQATRELNTAMNVAVGYMNNRSDFFTVKVGAFEIRFDLSKLGKPKEEGDGK